MTADRVTDVVGVLQIANPVLLGALIGRRSGEIGVAGQSDVGKAVNRSSVIEALHSRFLIEVRSLQRSAEIEIAAIVRDPRFIEQLRAEDVRERESRILRTAVKRKGTQGQIVVGIVLIVVVDGVVSAEL